jgi:hypothetical protein
MPLEKLKKVAEETRLFTQGNLINVSTQNNFCAYYVLARRIINDNNWNSILNKFNQFYQTDWNSDQLASVSDNMHPAHAELMIGLVLETQGPKKRDNQGLDPFELGELCGTFGYHLSVLQQEQLPNNLKESSFISFQENSQNNKEIFVFFHPPLDTSALGHYYLFEPNDMKAALDVSVRDSLQEYIYSINNEGSNTEIFIKNIKQSVASINKQINPSFVDDSKLSMVKPLLSESLSPVAKSLNIDKKTLQIKDDKYYAWQLALEEAMLITSENSVKVGLDSFKQALFFKRNHLKTSELSENDQAAAREAKSYVRDLQRKKIEFYDGESKSVSRRLTRKET